MEKQELIEMNDGQNHSENASESEDTPGLEDQEDVKPVIKNWYSAHQGGRPSSKGEAAKRWRDEETIELIKLWQANDVLYNNKNTLYFSKEEREKTVREIQNTLALRNIHATFEQIWDKLTNLKCYYGSQKREIEHKRSMEFKDYESPWKFYSYLSFLDDHLIPRKKRDNYNGPHNDFKLKQPKRPRFIGESVIYDVKCSPSPSMVHTYSSPPEHSATASFWNDQQPPPSMAAITSTTSNVTTTTTSPSDISKSEDATFCELMCKMLNQIPESEEKALLKIELQQRVVACRYRS